MIASSRALSHGFWMKSRAPAPHRLHRDLDAAPRRHHDDGQRGIDALDAREQVEAFLAGRRIPRVVQVDQRDVELARFDRRQHAGGGGCRLELEALGLEQQPQRFEDVGLVVGDQHARFGGTRGTRMVGGVAILQVVGDQHRYRVPQSVLSATSGSIRVARHAGMKLAIKRHAAEQRRRRRERQRIAHADAGQQIRRNQHAQHERHGDAGAEPDGDEEQSAREHQPQHRRRLRAERHAHANLTRALRDRVIGHAVEARPTPAPAPAGRRSTAG